jgi:BirA family biotin operon repressor/biotin-[acetyl-CoA-carboxylase] ligase
MPDPSPISLPLLGHCLGAISRRFDVDILPRCDSTNAVLLERAEAGAPSGTVVVAEEQTAGRGRRGRAWFSARGDSLTFSVLWRFSAGTPLSGLSLAAGLAAARALEPHSPGIQLKWPNDILRDGGKLGGILIELVPGAPHVAVIGIGINLCLPASLPDELRAGSAALMDVNGSVDQNQLLAGLLGELLTVLETFALTGFARMRNDWLRRHAFQDVAVILTSDFAASRAGICRGVDHSGALLIECDGRIESVLSGEMTLRSAS